MGGTVMVETMLTINEVAGLTQLSISHIYHLVKDKAIPHYKLGSAVMFKKTEIAEWLQSKRVYTKQEINREADTYTATH